MAKEAFKWPEFYSLPPFFTLQPVVATKKKQLKMWGELVTQYCRHHKKSVIRTQEDAKSELFANAKIDRKLSADGVLQVLEDLVAEGYGLWQDEKKSACAVTWKKFDDWGAAIYSWAAENNLMNNVATVYEIQAGKDSKDEEFHGLDMQVIMTALNGLVKQGRVTLIPGDSAAETGVKFHDR